VKQRADIGALLSGSHLPALDGLRAVAVGLVIAYHAGSPVPGDLGVTTFFVLSGFLITWLLLREFQASGAIALGAFYIRRTLRIFPAYFTFIFITFAIDAVRGIPRPAELTVAALTYTTNYYFAFHPHRGSLALTWSLAVEEQFYLLWPATLRHLLPRGMPTVRRFLAAVIVVVAAWRSFLYLGAAVGSLYVYAAFDTRADSLAIGGLLAAISSATGFAAGAVKVARQPWWPIVTVLLIGASRSGISDSWHYTLGFTLDSLLVAVLLVQLLQWHAHPLWRWLDSGVVRYLGRISYPLYLWHGYGLAVGARIGGPILVQRLAGVLASIVLASGSYYIIERPMLRLKQRFEPRREAA
jgi:peptidoglycan/LPS O-acetylase OafA/YrhL